MFSYNYYKLIMNNNTFNLTYLSPVGFLHPKYEFQYCLFCKGKIIKRCITCDDHIAQGILKNNILCPVNENEKMHVHCLAILEDSRLS